MNGETGMAEIFTDGPHRVDGNNLLNEIRAS